MSTTGRRRKESYAVWTWRVAREERAKRVQEEHAQKTREEKARKETNDRG